MPFGHGNEIFGTLVKYSEATTLYHGGKYFNTCYYTVFSKKPFLMQ